MSEKHWKITNTIEAVKKIDLLIKRKWKGATSHIWYYGIMLVQGCANVPLIQEMMNNAEQ
jgi:hypothetical protein